MNRENSFNKCCNHDMKARIIQFILPLIVIPVIIGMVFALIILTQIIADLIGPSFDLSTIFLLTCCFVPVALSVGIYFHYTHSTINKERLKDIYLLNAIIGVFIIFVMASILKNFKKLFEDMGARLPPATIYIFDLFKPLMQSYLWAIIAATGLGAILVGSYYFISSVKGRYAFQCFILFLEIYIIAFCAIISYIPIITISTVVG